MLANSSLLDSLVSPIVLAGSTFTVARSHSTHGAAMRSANASITTSALEPAAIVPLEHCTAWPFCADQQVSPLLAMMPPPCRRLGPRYTSRLTPLASEPAICFAPVNRLDATTVV